MSKAAKRETKAKQRGIELAAGSNKAKLELARAVAIRLGKQKHLVHADMVNEVMRKRYDIPTLGNAAGALFKTPEWRWTGQFHKSERKKNHSRLLRVWRYQPVQAS